MAAIRSNVMLKLGLITVSVAVHGALQQEESLNTVCRSGHAPVKVRQSLRCPQCDNADRGAFEKGRENADGTITVVDTTALTEVAPTEAEKGEMALTAHPAEQVDQRSLPGGKVYYLENKTSSSAYPLLVEVVKRNPEIAFVTMWAPRSRTAMFRLGVHHDTLTITELAWPSRVKPVPQDDATLDSEEMIPLAEQFIGQLMADFDPGHYTDRRTEVLQRLLDEGDTAEAGEPTEVAKPNNSLMDQLQAAVQAQQPTKKAKKKATKKATAKKAG